MFSLAYLPSENVEHGNDGLIWGGGEGGGGGGIEGGHRPVSAYNVEPIQFLSGAIVRPQAIPYCGRVADFFSLFSKVEEKWPVAETIYCEQPRNFAKRSG